MSGDRSTRSAETLKAGVVGLGLGSVHAAALAANPLADLVAVCDPDQARVAEIAGRHPGVAGYGNLERMLAEQELDVVSICTPDWMHMEMGEMALRAGSHVILTKPLANTVEEAQQLVATAAECGRTLSTAHDRRCSAHSRAVKEAIDLGRLGEIFYIEIDDFSHRGDHFAMAPWYKSAEHPRSAILGTGCHAVDLMRWFGGEVEEAWGVGNHLAYGEFPEDDCVVGLFKLASGAIGKVTVTYGSVLGYERFGGTRVMVQGTKGTVKDDRMVATDLFEGVNIPDIAIHHGWAPLPMPEQEHDSHRTQLDGFLADLAAGRAPQPDGAEGARTVAACLAAVESAATGQGVVPVRF